MKTDSIQSVLDQLEDIQRMVHKYNCDQTTSQTQVWHSLTVLQLRTLLFVKHQDKVNMRDIAAKLHITASSASLLITRLARTGWLTRVADQHDRRVVYLQLSKPAVQRLNAMTQLRAKRMQAILSSLSQKDLRDLQRIFTTLQTSLKSQAV